MTEAPKENDDYLKMKLRFVDDTILDENNDAVMMGWEGPLMELHAKVLCPEQGKDVLNVGFGLGNFVFLFTPLSSFPLPVSRHFLGSCNTQP